MCEVGAMAVYVQCNEPRVAGLASGRSEEGIESVAIVSRSTCLL